MGNAPAAGFSCANAEGDNCEGAAESPVAQSHDLALGELVSSPVLPSKLKDKDAYRPGSNEGSTDADDGPPLEVIKDEIEMMQDQLGKIEEEVLSFVVRYRLAVSSNPKMTIERRRILDEKIQRTAAELRRIERAQYRPPTEKMDVMPNVFLGMRKRRFKSLRAVVRKVMAEIRVARLLSRWTQDPGPGGHPSQGHTGHTGRSKFKHGKSMSIDFEEQLGRLQIEVWDGVDVLSLDQLTTEPLSQVFSQIYSACEMNVLVKAKKSKVLDYIRAVEKGYNMNPYHNNLHAAEVTLMTYQLFSNLSQLKAFKGYFEKVDLLVLLVAAAIHDIGHPATNNDFMVKTKSDLALRYHDTAVLENFHLATGFELMRERAVNVLEHNLPSPPVTSLRRRIVEIVLATDMATHKAQVDEMVRVVDRNTTNPQNIDKRALEQYMVHSADVGHALRPVPQHQEWARRVNEEFFAQGDREKELGLTPIEMFDREKAGPLCKGQLGFLKFVIQPLWNPLATLMGNKSKLATLFLQRNVKAWEEETNQKRQAS